MTIVFICQTFSENMGYISNCLPKALVKRGHEVHVISPNVQAYFSSPTYKETYESFLGPAVVPAEKKEIDGFTLHRLEHKRYKYEAYFKFPELLKTLQSIQPDIVQTFAVESIVMRQAYKAQKKLSFKLFGASHALRSVFVLADKWDEMSAFRKFVWEIRHRRVGEKISKAVELFYYQTEDAREIAEEFYGADPNKAKIDRLGVDTDHFQPQAKKNDGLRKKLGFTENDFICIYTGRFSKGKSPLLLAKAIHLLADKYPNLKGLFLGKGEQEKELLACKNCVVSPFVPFKNLPDYYNLATIGIWPREESTSMLDAMACGLPLIISDTVTATERVEGNGLTYKENDPVDLSKKIVELIEKGEALEEMAEIGIKRVQNQFSWDKVAETREKDYLNSLKE